VTCGNWDPEMVERARGGQPAGQAFSHHLAVCRRCAERWHAELDLSRELRALRGATAGLRSSAEAREQLMAAFGARRQPFGGRRRWLVWALAAMLVGLVTGSWVKVRQTARERIAQAELTTAGNDPDMLAENDFVPVPYALPLAEGERLEVVRAELTPAALARMGILVRAAYGTEVTTDLMVGEDGVPRAVRVPESVGIRY
jgi:hypothetical protein